MKATEKPVGVHWGANMDPRGKQGLGAFGRIGGTSGVCRGVKGWEVGGIKGSLILPKPPRTPQCHQTAPNHANHF